MSRFISSLDFVPVYALCLETYLKCSNFCYPMGVICRTKYSNLMQFEKYHISCWELHAKWFHILKINLNHSTMTCLEQLCWDALLIWQQVTNRQSVDDWKIKQREDEDAEINSVIDLQLVLSMVLPSFSYLKKKTKLFHRCPVKKTEAGKGRE